MKRVILCISFFLLVTSVYSAQSYDSILTQLNQVLDKKKGYDEEKLERISKLEQLLNRDENINLSLRYKLYLKLYNEYKSFDFSKAFSYAQKLQKAGHLLNDPVKIANGKIKLGFILLSSGMFKETIDSLKTVNIKLLPDSIKGEYYFLNSRTYYDLADFVNDSYYAPIYNRRAGEYIDSAIALCAPSSYEYQYYNGLKYLKQGDSKKAITYLVLLIQNYPLNNHQLAITASTLSDIYIKRKDEDEEAIQLLLKAAIADIKASTKEAAAMLNLAQILYAKGDIKNAYTFINQAMNDATYYGARHRKIQVSTVLKVIASGKVNSIEEQRRILFLYACLLTVLAIVVVVFAFIIYRQLKKIKQADEIIVEANASLQRTINKLNEANIIKEEYIGYYFNLISEYINKLEKFKRSIDNKLVTKKYDDIRMLVNNINLKKEREELFVNFDKAFLSIFPNFVESFNSFFDEENKIKLLPNQLMNTDLRIFALVRLGIHDTEKIANILEYSINTIYNYKARIKTKSNLPNDDFEQMIMTIKAV